MWDRGRMYLQKAGTIILASSIVLYICNNYPEKTVFEKDYDTLITNAAGNEVLQEQLANEKQAEILEYTVSGRVGKLLEPVFAPIGFDWKLTTASIGALSAKEVFVSQLGILYSSGEATEESEPLREHLKENYSPLQAFCIMLFSLLSIPCLATLAIMKRELNSWKMAAATGAGFFALAYITTFAVYQIGSLFGGGM